MHTRDIENLAGSDAYWALDALDRIASPKRRGSDVVVATLADDAGLQKPQPSPTIVLDDDEVSQIVDRRRSLLRKRLSDLGFGTTGGTSKTG